MVKPVKIGDATMKDYYKLSGLTRKQLAEITGLSERTIYRLEIRERKRPQWRTILLVSKVLKCPIEAIVPNYWGGKTYDRPTNTRLQS